MEDEKDLAAGAVEEKKKPAKQKREPAKRAAETRAPEQSEEERDLAAVRLETAKWELEHLKRKVLRERSEHERQIQTQQAQVQSMADANAQIEAQQVVCRHKKGGRDLHGIIEGDGLRGGYSVVRHTYNAGDIGVMCQRCSKQWFRPGSLIQKACAPRQFQAQAASAAVREQQAAEYAEAMAWPSDNSPSGTQTHLVTRRGAAAAEVA